ncbi:hypothetical protein [Aeromonas veronii]|uniref:hypothetical protein n=1 Tax=Aeromonas veronii TaxID=654 RepID=UPI002444B54D|nr:hypothetical protein [Aeromonas veronii]
MPAIQYSSVFCCRCGEPSTTSYSALCHSATLPLCHSATLPLCHSATLPLCHSATLPLRSFFILLFRDCPTALLSIVMLLI